MTSPKYLLLFDIDGTLLLGRAGLHTAALNRAARAVLHPEFDICSIESIGALDAHSVRVVCENLGIVHDFTLIEIFKQIYFYELEKVAPKANVLAGVHELIAYLREREDTFALAIVTGNYRESARVKLDLTGVGSSNFRFGAYGDLDTTRDELVRITMREAHEIYGHPFEPQNVVVIGDTFRDIDCAKQNGCRVIAVPTGWVPKEQLVTANPDYILDDLTDIDAFVRCVTDK